MGGDAGLAVTIPGALLFLRQQADVRLLMVGDEVQVRQALEAANAPMDRIQIVHAAQVVEMDEQPQSALKNKKDSSMRIAVNQVKEGLAQAAVSAGNTGALMATARFVLKTIQGIERPAIAKFIPSQNGHMTLVLDLGVNVDCTPEQLVQFCRYRQRIGVRTVSECGRAACRFAECRYRRHQRHGYRQTSFQTPQRQQAEFCRQC